MAHVVELLGGRYELEEQIGSGGMGEVYRARDLLLDRVVAVKRPTEPFAGSARERFRREARSAARLNHPHVVAVYDTGDDGDSAYLVMELVEGRSLRELLREQGTLTPMETARVGAQIADALAHAHSKGIVHRDVKPSNVLLTTTGSVKVTDFGIAHWAAADTITDPGVVIGTAGYLAPEQVAGNTADARSDIYSLGVVLTELLTGQREPDGLRELDHGADELRLVVLRARESEPSARYARATEAREALRVCARTTDGIPAVDPARISAPAEPRTGIGEPRTGIVVDVGTATAAGLGRTVVVQTGTVATPTKVIPPPRRPPTDAPAPRLPTPPARATAAPAPATAVAAVPVATPVLSAGKPTKTKATKAKAPRRWRRSHLAWMVAAPVAVALTAAGALAYTQLTAKPDVTVPSAVGQDQDAATAALRTAGFDVETVMRPSAIPGGIVLAQRPRDGKRIPEGDTVRIFVSDAKAEMPDLFGINEIDAATSLRNLGLVNIAYVDRFTDAADPGSVVASDPLAHQFALKSGTVTLTIARDTTVRVPEVRTFSEADARAKLEFAGYVVAVARASSRTVPVGSVISVSPAVSSIGTRGDTATLKVSTGPPLVSVPNVVGEDADDARDDLEGRGLVVNEVTVAITSGSSGKVISQDPTGGQLAEGSTVTINVGRRTR